MDFFDFSKPLPKICIKGGQTNGHITVTDSLEENTSDQEFKEDENYAHKYVLEEKEELCKLENNDGNESPSGSFTTTNSGIDELISIDATLSDECEMKKNLVKNIYDIYFSKNSKKNNSLIINEYREKVSM